jgi:hypothetical protein
VINVLNQFDFFSAVPVNGSASYTEISRAVQLPESTVRRILRHAMTMRLFSESPPGSGQVVHSAATAHVVKHPLVRSWIAHNMEEVEPACGKLPEALKKFSMGKLEATEEVDETPFGLSHLDEKGKPMTFWQFIQSDGQGDNKGYREPRFAEAMQIASRASNPNSETVGQGFDWADLGKATVVDVSCYLFIALLSSNFIITELFLRVIIQLMMHCFLGWRLFWPRSSGTCTEIL